MVETKMLGGPHLMLPDVGGEDRFTICCLCNGFHDGVWLRPRRPLFECLVERSVAPRIYPSHPVVVASSLDLGDQKLQHFTRVADHGNVGSDILPDLGRVDIDVNDECV